MLNMSVHSQYIQLYNELSTQNSGYNILHQYRWWIGILSKISINTQWNAILIKNGVSQRTIDIANEFINGASNFVTLNRFIATMQFISKLQNGKITQQDALNEIKARDDFIYVLYTLVPDGQINQLSLPLQMYEMKTNKNSSIESFKTEIRRFHNIDKEDFLCVCDIQNNKINGICVWEMC